MNRIIALSRAIIAALTTAHLFLLRMASKLIDRQVDAAMQRTDRADLLVTGALRERSAAEANELVTATRCVKARHALCNEAEACRPGSSARLHA